MNEIAPYPRYHGNVIRPPSEADSLILQVMYGCSHGKCTFCGSYMGKAFRLRPLDAVIEDIEGLEGRRKENVRKVFLCDGDVLAVPLARMLSALDLLASELPNLTRVSAYANAHSLLRMPDEELRELRAHGLELLYVGLESGDDDTLARSGKGLSSAQQVRACRKARGLDFSLSVTAIVGLGGLERSMEHARATGRALSAVDPQHIGILSLTLEPGTPLAESVRRGIFVLPGPAGLLKELREMIVETAVAQALFRTENLANNMELKGTLPADKAALLATLDGAIAAGTAPSPRPEGFRAL
jgi:radical SAM superfamily enzyme YgiQ (UPF0313 family)